MGGCPIGQTGRKECADQRTPATRGMLLPSGHPVKEVTEMKGMLKAVVYDMNFNELRVALLAVIAFVQTGTFITVRDLEEIIDEAKRS